MENKETATAYIRVSTSDQENSLEVQEKRIREYATFKNLTLTDIIIDEDVSGGKELYKRKEGSRIQHTTPGSSIIAIKPDRLFRNLKDALITVDQWNRDNIALHIVDMGGSSITTKTAIGRLMFSTIIAFAEFERNITGERVKAILNDRKDKGKAYCRPMLGFDRIGGETSSDNPGRTRGGHLIPNPAEQLIIQKIFQLSATLGYTDIANTLNQAGHRTKTGLLFRDNTIKYILNNPIYKEPLKTAS